MDKTDALFELSVAVSELVYRMEKLEQNVALLNDEIAEIQRRLNNPAEYES